MLRASKYVLSNTDRDHIKGKKLDRNILRSPTCCLAGPLAEHNIFQNFNAFSSISDRAMIHTISNGLLVCEFTIIMMIFP